MDYHGMKRKELQKLCKQHGIPSNLTNLEMANKLSTLLKIEEKSKPIRKTRSCLKICSDVLSENESDLMNKKGKKVRFSPENDVFQFRDRKVEFLELDDVRRGRRKKGKADDEGDLDVENKGEGDLSRVTRAKALLGQKVTLSSPVVMKKRAKRGVQEDEKRGNGSNLVVDLNSCVSEERNETVAVKSLRNRKVESVVPAKSIVRKRNARTGIQSVGGEALENKDVEADGGISHLKTGVRRSTRNVKTSEASDRVIGEMGCSKPLGSRHVSSVAQVAVAAGCETESEPQVKNDDVPVISGKNLRKKGAKNTTSKCKDNGSESDIVEKEENVAPPKMSLRRSSRNEERTEDSGQLVVELPAVDLLQRKNVRSAKGSIQGVETNRKNVRSVKDSIQCDEKISETAVTKETDLKVLRKITRQSAKSSVEDVDQKAVTGKLANPEVVPRQSKRKRSELAQVEPVQDILGGTEVAGRRKITRSRNQAQAKTSILDGKSGDVTAKANEVPPLQHFADDIEVPPKSAESLRYQTRFSDKRISLTPQTKKAKVEKPVPSNIGKRSTVNRGSPNQSTELLPLEKGSEIEHVRRSKRNALGDESHVISEDAHGSDFKRSMTKKQGRETIGENVSLQHTGQHVSRTPDNLPDKLVEGTAVAVESRTRSGFEQKSFKHTAKKLRMSGKPTIDKKDSRHRSREHSTTPEHSETALKVRKSQNASKTSLLAASSSAYRVTRSNTVADEPRTRSGICLKSVKHTTKKLRMSGKPGIKKTNNEKGSPDKSRECSIATGHSETDSEVRRSNNAYETKSLAASSDANGTGIAGIVSTEHVSGVEEHSEQFTHSARNTNTNQTSSMKELSLKEPESSSAPPIPDCNTVLGGSATGSHLESSSGAIAKDGIPCSMEASAKNVHLADAKDPLNMGEAETSTTCSIKLPADEDLVNESCNNNQTPVVHGPSRRFTRSALKGKTDGPTYGRGKTFNAKSHSISKLPLLNAESSLPKAVTAGAGPGDVNVSSSCPKVDTPTINIVSSTSDLSEDKTACVTPERSLAKHNIIDLYLQESKGPESLNTLKASPSEPLKLQSNYDENEVDISTSKHTPVVKPSSYDLQASIPQIVGHISYSVSRENNKSEANDSSLPLCVTEVGNLVAVVNEEQKHEESPSLCSSDIRPDTAAEDDKSLCKEQASISSADDFEHNQIEDAKDESEIRTIRDISDVPEVVSVSQASGDYFVGEKCTEIELNLDSASVEKVLAVEVDSEAVDKVPSDVKDRCHTPLMDNCGKGEGTAMSMMKSNTNFGEEFSSQHDNRVEQVKDFDDATLAHTVANQMDAEPMRSTGKCTSETDAHYDERIEKTGPSTIEINSLISDGNLVEDGGSYCEISGKVEADITSLSDSKEDLYGKDTLECQQFVDVLQQSDDMKIGETDTHLKENDEEIDHQSVHILQQSDMNVGETGSDLEVTDQENGHRLVDALQQSDKNAGKTDSNLKGIDQENDDTPIIEQADVVIVIADNGESSRDNVNAIDAIHVIDQEGDAKRVPTEELQRKESAVDAAPAKFLHGGESVTFTGETNDAAIDTIHIFDEVVDASNVLTEKLQWNEDAMEAPTKLQQGGLTSTVETNEAQGISANDTTHISDQEVDASNVELQWNEDTMEAPTKLQHDGLTSTEETNEVQGISANDTTHVSDQEVDATNMEFQRNEDAMEAAPSKLQHGGGESLTSTEEANEAQCGCTVQTIHLFDLDVDASGAITEDSKRNEYAMDIAPAKLQYGVESVASHVDTIEAQGGSTVQTIHIFGLDASRASPSIEETDEAQGISANDITHVSDQEVDVTNMEFQRNEDVMEAAPANLQHGGGESLTSMEEAYEAQGGCAVQTFHIFDLDVDASRAITEESERNEDAMETAPAKLQYGGENVTSPEKTIEVQGGSSANLVDISDCGPGELSFNIENLSPEMKSFIRSDEVNGENSHLWSEDTSFMFDKSNNAEEQDNLTGYTAEEHVHNSGEELVGERAVEERETFNDIQAVEHLCNTGEEVFREEYTELTENQYSASYNPNHIDDNNAVENIVATHNETNSESLANEGAHQNNACDYTKPNED